MKIDIHADQMTNKLQIVSMETGGKWFTGLEVQIGPVVTVDFYNKTFLIQEGERTIVEGSFGDDDDVSLLTFWGQKTLIPILERALELLKAQRPDGAA